MKKFCSNKKLKRFIFLLLTLPLLTLAQEEIYTAMDIGDLARTIYNWIVKASGICALLMIVWGGTEYALSTANPQKLKEAEEKIKYAIYGLLIVLLSWLLLYIINPKLVRG